MASQETKSKKSHKKSKTVPKKIFVPKTSKPLKTDVFESPKTPEVPISKSVPRTKTPDPKKYVKKTSLFTDSRQPVSTWYNSYPRKSQTTYKPNVKVVRDDKLGVTKYHDRYGWLPSTNVMKSKVPKELQKEIC